MQLPDDRAGYSDQAFVSSWNFAESSDGGTQLPLIVHDTTLRDGEQQAGVVFTPDEKFRIACALDEAGVNRIEAGMVAVSEDDRLAIKSIVEASLSAEIWTIARAVPSDIAMAIDAGVDGTGIILLANSQYRKIFGWTLETAIAGAIESARTARGAGLQTTLLLADAPRFTHRELQQVVDATTGSGEFTAISIMDTFGTLNPAGTRRLVQTLREWTPLPLELHAHNDFGLATANSLAGLEAGANVVHTTVLGLGERVGNAALEEVVVAANLLQRADTTVDLARLTNLAQLVSADARHPIATNKPIVGTRIQQIESGTVAAEYARWSAAGEDLQWLFPFVPAVVGAADPQLVLGKYSGIANVDWVAHHLGIGLPEDQKAELLSEFKAEGIRLHRTLVKDDIVAVIARVTGRPVSELVDAETAEQH